MKMTHVQTRLALVALASLATTPSCILVAAPGPGSISFLWSFDGEPSCVSARVAEIDVFVTDGDDVVEYEATRVSCEGGGLTLPDIDAGTKTVIVEGYSARGTLLFVGSAPAVVESGKTTDIGEILLARPGSTDNGDLAFFWTFGGVTSCTSAGVAEVDLEIVDDNDNQLLFETVNCEGGGVVLLDIPPGNHTFFLDGYGSNDAYLYAAAESVSIVAGRVTDIGTVDLAPLDAGSFRAAWSFPGGVTCAAAGVAEVDVEIWSDNDLVALETYACAEGEATITGLPSGEIEVFVDGYSSANAHLYTASLTTTIVTGSTTDAGDVLLSLIDDTGDVIFDIGFLYPTNSAETNCVRAGVTEVDVVIAPAGHAGPGHQETLTCVGEAGALLVTGLAPGEYTLSMDAYGVFNAADLHLYASGPESFTVVTGNETDLGPVDMSRVDANFGSLNVAFAPDGGTCADLGVGNIAFTVTRTSGVAPVVDDTFTKPCANASEIRLNYVPGDYEIAATAMGTAGTYVDVVTTTVSPGASGVATVALTLQ